MLRHSHPWGLSPKQAISLQETLACFVICKRRIGSVSTVGGVDVSMDGPMARSAVVVLDYPGLRMIEYATATRRVTFPYIPGLLSFREGPAILDAVGKLSTLPDFIIFDGQGLAHPRRFGIASHIGLLLDRPTIGCAKSRLLGNYKAPALEQGSYTLLIDKGQTIGAVLRTQKGVKPIYVSIGHRIDLPTSIEFVKTCCRGYR